MELLLLGFGFIALDQSHNYRYIAIAVVLAVAVPSCLSTWSWQLSAINLTNHDEVESSLRFIHSERCSFFAPLELQTCFQSLPLKRVQIFLGMRFRCFRELFGFQLGTFFLLFAAFLE